MSRHVSKVEMEAFCERTGSAEGMAFIGAHIAICRLCRELFREVLQERRSTSGKRFSIGPAFWLKHEHLEYEQTVSYADQLMDSDEREIPSKST